MAKGRRIFLIFTHGIAQEQAVSEDQKYAAKKSLPETDSSAYFGIKVHCTLPSIR